MRGYMRLTPPGLYVPPFLIFSALSLCLSLSEPYNPGGRLKLVFHLFWPFSPSQLSFRL